jgi:hypothetical protein
MKRRSEARRFTVLSTVPPIVARPFVRPSSQCCDGSSRRTIQPTVNQTVRRSEPDRPRTMTVMMREALLTVGMIIATVAKIAFRTSVVHVLQNNSRLNGPRKGCFDNETIVIQNDSQETHDVVIEPRVVAQFLGSEFRSRGCSANTCPKRCAPRQTTITGAVPKRASAAASTSSLVSTVRLSAQVIRLSWSSQ